MSSEGDLIISAESLKEKLNDGMSLEYVSVEDVSGGCGGKFNAIIVTDDFEGKRLLQRHRMVNKVLEEELKDIHAFSMRTWTVKEFEEKKESNEFE